MSLIVTELERVIDRIVVLAPTEPELRDAFESLTVELTTRYSSPGVSANLATAFVPGPSPLAAWASFDFGRRSTLTNRVCLLGYSLDRGLPHIATLELCEGLIFWIPKNTPEIDAFLRLKLSDTLKALPCLLRGLPDIQQSDKADLRSAALTSWFTRNFRNLSPLSLKGNSLGESLEWILSF